MSIQLSEAKWLNPPKTFNIVDDINDDIAGQSLTLTTDPHTDFWQRSYYGFRNDNAHALLWKYADNFSFTAKAFFNYRSLFDQCGLAIYLDSDNWFKASIEYETPDLARLGSVVTNLGYSDWATTDIATPTSMWYRLSRRGPDFLIENSTDGQTFHQMRVFHLHRLGETTLDMGRQDPPAPPAQPIAFGLYACSPLDASFQARFDQLKLEPCQWKAHSAE